jgi:hypothetical protein
VVVKNLNYLDAPWEMLIVGLTKIMPSTFFDTAQLCSADYFAWPTKQTAGSSFNLEEDHLEIFLGNNVDLPEFGAKIAGENLILELL